MSAVAQRTVNRNNNKDKAEGNKYIRAEEREEERRNGGGDVGGVRNSTEMKWRPATVLKDTACHYVIRNVHR